MGCMSPRNKQEAEGAATTPTWRQSATAATPFPSSLERSTRGPKEHKECDAHHTGREELACCLMYQTYWNRRTFCNKLLFANTIPEWENGNSVWIQSKWLRCCTQMASRISTSTDMAHKYSTTPAWKYFQIEINDQITFKNQAFIKCTKQLHCGCKDLVHP